MHLRALSSFGRKLALRRVGKMVPFLETVKTMHLRIELLPNRVRNSPHSWWRRGSFGLLAALGVLAFFFSVISPNDDDIQQEFIQGHKPKQVVVCNHKNAGGQRSGTGRYQYALATQKSFISCRNFAHREFISDEQLHRTVVSNHSRDRAPPSKSS